jgi:hypothetical protein
LNISFHSAKRYLKSMDLLMVAALFSIQSIFISLIKSELRHEKQSTLMQYHHSYILPFFSITRHTYILSSLSLVLSSTIRIFLSATTRSVDIRFIRMRPDRRMLGSYTLAFVVFFFL